MKEKITFENFLRDKHYKEYHGTDDDMADDFDKWLTELQADDFIKYGDEYADWKIKECLPEKNNTEIKATGEGGIYEQGGQDGWNACIDQTLINKDKIK